MKKIFMFFIIATSLTIGAGLSQIPALNGIAGSWSTNIKEHLQPGDDNRHESINPANESHSSGWEPQTLLLIVVGLIGLGLKRRQRS